MPAITQNPIPSSETGSHPLALPPASTTAMVGANPITGNANWVPTAMPDRRTLVGKISE